eukprot:14913920-Heterocapsa_arctica.AAC.1
MKRRREGPRDSDSEEDSEESCMVTTLEDREMIEYPEGVEVMMEEDKNIWEKHIGVPAILIEQLECQARTRARSDTEFLDCNSGVGMWIICRNPTCYRCNIIDKAEMQTQIPLDKGETIIFIRSLRTEDTSWKETT